MRNIKYSLLMALAALIWGSAFVAQKLFLKGRDTVPVGVLIGALAITGTNILYCVANKLTTAGNTKETTVQTQQTTKQSSKQTTRQSYSTTTRTTVTTTTVTQEKAPQTGQLWWPVPILAVGGVVLLGFGVHLTKKDDNE